MKRIYDYTVLIEQGENGVYIAKVPDIPGCYTQGKTVEQVMECLKADLNCFFYPEKPETYESLKFIGVQRVKVAAT